MIELRPYQTKCVKACYAAWENGHKRILVSLATGLGKTVVFSDIAARHVQKNPGSKVLVIAHLSELLTQAQEKLGLVSPGLKSFILRKGLSDPDSHVHFISIQSAAKPNTLMNLKRGGYGLVVVDEAHHAPADEYAEVLESLGCFSETRLLGVTATPFRNDELTLDSIFEKTVFQKGILEGIIEGYLSDLRGIEIPIDCDLSSSSKGADYDAGKLGRLLKEVLPRIIPETLTKYAPERKAIVFVPTVEVARDVAAALTQQGFLADHVSGQDRPNERERKLKDYAANKIRVLVNAMLLTEGFDEPSIGVVVVGRPTKSKNLYLQMIGRGTRLNLENPDCLILDIVPEGHHSPTLTLSEIAKVDPIDSRQRGMRALFSSGPRRIPHIAYNWGEGQERNLFSERTWSRFEPDVYGIQVEKASVVLMPVFQPELNQLRYDVYFQEGDRREFIHRSLPLAYAQGVAEDVIRDRNAHHLTSTQADWRTKPATDSQLEILHRMGAQLTPTISRGEASEIIQQSKLRRVVEALLHQSGRTAA